MLFFNYKFKILIENFLVINCKRTFFKNFFLNFFNYFLKKFFPIFIFSKIWKFSVYNSKAVIQKNEIYEDYMKNLQFFEKIFSKKLEMFFFVILRIF